MATNVRVINRVPVDVDFLPLVDVDVSDLPDIVVHKLPDITVDSLPDMRITDIGPMGPLTLAGIPSNYTVGITSLPEVSIRIREIPSIRAHIPANFRLGFSVFGVELAALHLCGEAQVITEPFVPNPCERCGTPNRTPNPNSTVGTVVRLRNG